MARRIPDSEQSSVISKEKTPLGEAGFS